MVNADEQRTGPETARGEDFEISKHDSIIDSISPPVDDIYRLLLSRGFV